MEMQVNSIIPLYYNEDKEDAEFIDDAFIIDAKTMLKYNINDATR